jgi:hypothetical protein
MVPLCPANECSGTVSVCSMMSRVILCFVATKYTPTFKMNCEKRHRPWCLMPRFFRVIYSRKSFSTVEFIRPLLRYTAIDETSFAPLKLTLFRPSYISLPVFQIQIAFVLNLLHVPRERTRGLMQISLIAVLSVDASAFSMQLYLKRYRISRADSIHHAGRWHHTLLRFLFTLLSVRRHGETNLGELYFGLASTSVYQSMIVI